MGLAPFPLSIPMWYLLNTQTHQVVAAGEEMLIWKLYNACRNLPTPYLVVWQGAYPDRIVSACAAQLLPDLEDDLLLSPTEEVDEVDLAHEFPVKALPVGGLKKW